MSKSNPQDVWIKEGKIFMYIGANGIIIDMENNADMASTPEEKIRIYSEIIEKYPQYPLEYNNRAFQLRKLGEYEEALKDANYAISMLPEEALYICTRAEIYSAMNEDKKFFVDIENVLEKGFPVWDYTDDSVYQKYLQDKKFINLIDKAKVGHKKYSPTQIVFVRSKSDNSINNSKIDDKDFTKLQELFFDIVEDTSKSKSELQSEFNKLYDKYINSSTHNTIANLAYAISQNYSIDYEVIFENLVRVVNGIE